MNAWRADAAIISDTGFFEGNVPAITVSLRGLMYAQIDVRLGAIDLHSGSYGGAVANPAVALAQIIAALKGPDGRIRIPGFYDDVVASTDAEREAIAALPFDEEAFRVETGVPALVGESGYSTLERKSVRPTLDVNGIWGGFQGEGSKTIIPATAHAKISTRLVADQDPNDVFEKFKAFVEEIAPPGVDVTVTLLGMGRADQDPDRPPVRRCGGPGPGGACSVGRPSSSIRRVDPDRRQLPVDPRPAGRARGLHPAERPRPRAERVVRPRQLRGRHPDDRRHVR